MDKREVVARLVDPQAYIAAGFEGGVQMWNAALARADAILAALAPGEPAAWRYRDAWGKWAYCHAVDNVNGPTVITEKQALYLAPGDGEQDQPSSSDTQSDGGPVASPSPAPGVAGEDSLTVETAAIRIGSAVFTLPRPNRHHNILWWLSVLGARCARPSDQGFVLSNGHYVSRTAAAELALSNGQVTKLISPPHLYSEDLWDGGADMVSASRLRAIAQGAADREAAVPPDERLARDTEQNPPPTAAQEDPRPSPPSVEKLTGENEGEIGAGLPEPLQGHVHYINAALSYYDNYPAGQDVRPAWQSILDALTASDLRAAQAERERDEALAQADTQRTRATLLIQRMIRLGSMEALVRGGVVKMPRDEELLARIEYARAAEREFA